VKASTLLKAWAYAELGFIGYLLLRPGTSGAGVNSLTNGLPPDQKAALDDITTGFLTRANIERSDEQEGK
jgi:hypothetical protein